MDFYRFFVDVGYYVLYSICNNRLFGYLEYWKNFGLKYVKLSYGCFLSFYFVNLF